MEKDEKLTRLLNDESFIRWLNGEASADEKNRWDEWVKEEQNAEVIVRKARKFISMPFEEEHPADTQLQLYKLLRLLETPTNLVTLDSDT